MASVSGSVSLVSNHSTFMGSGVEHRAVFLKPWSSSPRFGAMVVEAKSRTSSDDRIARHSRIRKKVTLSFLPFRQLQVKNSLNYSLLLIASGSCNWV